MRKLIITIVISLFIYSSGTARDVVDQEQLMTTNTPLAIGGGSQQKIAQSFTVGTDGTLTQIRVPVSCSSGELIVEIQRLNADGEPNGVVVASARISAEDLPAPSSEFKTIVLSPPLVVDRGDKFAIVLRNPTGTCVILNGPSGDSYRGGRYFYDSRPNPPGWVGGKDRPAPRGTPGDIPFQTLIDDGTDGSNLCFGTFGAKRIPLPISRDVPVCYCLSDAGSNSWRCRILHPDFFLIRRVEFLPNARGRFVERWAFTPLTRLASPVKISFKGAGMKRDVIYEFGKRSRIGSFEHYRISRTFRKLDRTIPGEVMFSYQNPNVISSYQKMFGFDATLSTRKNIKNRTKLKK